MEQNVEQNAEQNVEQNVEVKEVKPKKKRNWVFTLFACIATGVIVFLAMNIGQNLSKTVEPDTNKSNNKEVTCEEKECDCKEENTTTETNSNSNTTTSNSNTTQQQPQTQPTATTYTVEKVMGTYEVKTDTYTRTIILSNNGLFEITGSVKNGGGYSILGNYIIENNTIKLNQMIDQQAGGATALDKVVTANIISADTISFNNETYKKTNNDYGMTMQSWSDVIAAYVKTTEI